MKQTIADKIRKWRSDKGLSQSQAAKELGVPVKTLQNWEIGRREPNTKTLISLLERGVLAISMKK